MTMSNAQALLALIQFLGANAHSTPAQAQEAQRQRGKITSKCHHGERGRAGDKLARLAAEHRLGTPAGRPSI